ncbi:MAG: type II secretion system F family protein [Deferrisomatales bacterium]|nr:type II secretion system F family protein [Deferrisomatales bacterium]
MSGGAVLLFYLAVFLFTAGAVGAGYLWLVESRFSEKRLVRRRLMYLSAGGMHGEEKFVLYKDEALRNAGPLGKLLYRLPRSGRLDRLLLRSGFPLNASTFLLLSLGLAAGGGFLGALLPVQPPLGSVVGALLGAVPYLLLVRADAQFVKAFEEQLPEALDFVVRAMRSGHAFTSALEMAGQELGEPVAPELAAAVDQIKFGLSVPDALENLCRRTSVDDLRFFSIAVTLHKEAGGNITEVFSKISQIIRQRLQFRRQVRALTAEGRFSAVVLLLLPIGLFLYIYVINFEYISLLWTDEIGKVMVAAGLVGMVVGYAIMTRMARLDL